MSPSPEGMSAFKLWWRFLTNQLTVDDGSLCEFSRRYFDQHDYHKGCGGDGYPCHLHLYHCSRCGRQFRI